MRGMTKVPVNGILVQCLGGFTQFVGAGIATGGLPVDVRCHTAVAAASAQRRTTPLVQLLYPGIVQSKLMTNDTSFATLTVRALLLLLLGTWLCLDRQHLEVKEVDES